MENPHKETALPAGLRRVKMPTDLPWSGLIAWMHRKIAEHTANSARWYHLNVAANPNPSKAKAKARPVPTTEEKRAKTAEYMRAYRKRIKDQRTKLYKEIDSGALMYRTALTKWQNRVHWIKKNRRRLLRAGKWRGFPIRPDKATFLTKKAKTAR